MTNLSCRTLGQYVVFTSVFEVSIPCQFSNCCLGLEECYSFLDSASSFFCENTPIWPVIEVAAESWKHRLQFTDVAGWAPSESVRCVQDIKISFLGMCKIHTVVCAKCCLAWVETLSDCLVSAASCFLNVLLPCCFMRAYRFRRQWLLTY